jgi:hypothetical protein
MPSCPEAGQRAKQNRTCHSAQASLRSLLLEESCIRKNKNLNLKAKLEFQSKRKFKEKTLNQCLASRDTLRLTSLLAAIKP